MLPRSEHSHRLDGLSKNPGRPGRVGANDPGPKLQTEEREIRLASHGQGSEVGGASDGTGGIASDTFNHLKFEARKGNANSPTIIRVGCFENILDGLVGVGGSAAI